MLKHPVLPRLLKKVQMQDSAPGTHPADGHLSKGWVPGRWAFFSSLLKRVQERPNLPESKTGPLGVKPTNCFRTNGPQDPSYSPCSCTTPANRVSDRP
jgi:hypothetical protein